MFNGLVMDLVGIIGQTKLIILSGLLNCLHVRGFYFFPMPHRVQLLTHRITNIMVVNIHALTNILLVTSFVLYLYKL